MYDRLIYVAGPYRASTEWQLEQNIRTAETATVRLVQKGYAVICPHKNTAHLGGVAPDETWLQICLEIVNRCDAIYLLKTWRESKGAVREWKRAIAKGLTIYEQGVNEPPDLNCVDSTVSDTTFMRWTGGPGLYFGNDESDFRFGKAEEVGVGPDQYKFTITDGPKPVTYTIKRVADGYRIDCDGARWEVPDGEARALYNFMAQERVA